MSKNDFLKITCGIVTIFAFMISVMFVISQIDSEVKHIEHVWAHKCKDAGGIPSKYKIMYGKTLQEERACFHPSALIEID